VSRAAKVHSSLSNRSISPHTIRHTTNVSAAIGRRLSVIALCVGHESTTTTHRYVEADLAMKDKTLARLQEPDTKMRRYHPPDDVLMQFLQAL
jgi:integrase